jgi:hypothetical protein
MNGTGGDFDSFADAFPTDLLPAVFALVLKEWPNGPRPEGNPLENRITNRFVGHLQDVMRRTPTPAFKFLPRPKLVTADADSESGEVDIYVDSFSRHPDAYFVFECKRLNVPYDSGASKYVGEAGMGRFISGQYPTSCDCGGMLGYVMDGNVPVAVTAINKALRDHKEELRLRSPHELEPSTITADDDVYQTAHNKNQHPLVIYHLLLPFFIPPQAASS